MTGTRSNLLPDTASGQRPIPVARPLLPESTAIARYLRESDQSRIYSNFGPLCCRFEQRLAALYGLSAENVVTVSNATMGLSSALLALTGGKPGLCYLPSWTFCASAHAARLAGLEPYFLDVDPNTWQLTPAHVRAAVANTKRPGVVLVVAPFGNVVDASEWDAFANETGMPVVIDAAASVDAQNVQFAPVVISLHATKALGIGEGGFVVSRDKALIVRIRQVTNFGFHETRTSKIPALNAKLSEYGAAVGLAALDGWPQARRQWLRLQERYWSAMAALNAGVRPVRPARLVSSTFVARFSVLTDQLEEALAKGGIVSRRWWGHGCHRDPAFANCRREPLPVTDDLAEHTLGLPFFVDMTEAEIESVAEGVAAASNARP
jgi:dTDP-4-amino-4,6-dideoxygalactose transaminase